MTPSFPGGKSGCGHGAGMEGEGLVGPRVPGYWEQTAEKPSEMGREGKEAGLSPGQSPLFQPHLQSCNDQIIRNFKTDNTEP